MGRLIKNQKRIYMQLINGKPNFKQTLMITIQKATEKDYPTIVRIGNISVEEAHRESCSAEDMRTYLDAHYNDEAIKKELNNPDNTYHIIYYKNEPVGFSKIVLNAEHPNIPHKNATKLDRIYLLSEYHNLKLGLELLQFNISFCKNNHQCGIWLFTWVGNEKAVNFYLKTGFTIIGSHQFKVSETHYNLNHQMYLDLTSAND